MAAKELRIKYHYDPDYFKSKFLETKMRLIQCIDRR